MIKKYILILNIIFISGFGFSQEKSSDNSKIFSELQSQTNGGNVKIYQSPTLRLEIDKHLESFAKKEGIYGYRIQIFFGSSKSAKQLSNQARVKFISEHKDINAYINYSAPYFKVRVGDFRTQSEAIKLLQEILPEYPEAFVVKDIINVETE